MKKLLVLITFLVFGQLSLNAQNDFKFGFELSPGVNWLSTNSAQVGNNGSHLGLRLGMLAEYYFADNYSIETGLSLNLNQGGKLKYTLPGNYLVKSDLTDPTFQTGEQALSAGSSINYKLQYIEIPFALKMRTQEFGYFRYYATIPMFSLNILTKATGTINDPAPNRGTLEKENIRPDVGFMTIAWGLGGGVEYMLSENTTLVAGLYYKQSFIDVTRDKGYSNEGLTDETREQEDSKANLNTITLKLGVLF